jgi:hypothetical protein
MQAVRGGTVRPPGACTEALPLPRSTIDILDVRSSAVVSNGAGGTSHYVRCMSSESRTALSAPAVCFICLMHPCGLSRLKSDNTQGPQRVVEEADGNQEPRDKAALS